MKPVMALGDLVKEGYPEGMLRRISKSEDFPLVGFREDGKKTKIYFYVSKLEKYLERRTMCQF